MANTMPIDHGGKKRAPKWSLREKPEMIIGAGVPSWTKSIPGPKYVYKTDMVKDRAPNWTMREKPELVVGGNNPTWTKMIPGPKYVYPTDVNKTRQPQYSMPGRDDKVKQAASAPQLSPEALQAAFDFTKKKPSAFSLKSRPLVIPGAPPPNKNVPGAGDLPKTDKTKRRQPAWDIAGKLPTEFDMMKKRSPGPVYDGCAIDAKKQAAVDSTKRRTPAPGFGVGERWKGTEYELVRSGAAARYNRPR